MRAAVWVGGIALAVVAVAAGVIFLFRDWRDYTREERARVRAMGE